MKLTMRKSNWLTDWYVIELTEHDGHEWWREVEPDSFTLECSARIGDADVEGTAADMIELAGAILDRTESHAKRCAVRIDGDRAFFWSPRNSRRKGEVPYSDTEALAREIIEQLKQGGEPKGETP